MRKERELMVTDLCSAMIREKSLSGQEQGVVRVLKEAMEKMKFDDVAVDKYGNCIGHIKGNRPGRKILFDGHMDIVPVGNEDEWTHDPFGGIIEDGRMWGRGTSDMKCAIGSMACAAAFFAEDTGRDFAGDIYVAGVCHEECFEGVAAREISKNVEPDYVVIGEASQLNLKIGQRGRAEIKVETFGRPAHSANPEAGINAACKMNDLIQRIRQIKLSEHPHLGKGILELSDIKSYPYPGASVVPEYCVASFDRRLLVGETRESVLEPIRKLIDEMSAKDPDFKAKVSYAHGKEMCFTGEEIEDDRFFPGWIFDEEEEYVQKIYKEFVEMGHTPEIGYWHFCTNGSHYGGERGIKTIGFGPGDLNTAHIIDEYMPVDQLIEATRLYEGIMKALLV